MNRHLLGILASVTFGLLDALMVGLSDHADKSTAMLLQHSLTLGFMFVRQGRQTLSMSATRRRAMTAGRLPRAGTQTTCAQPVWSATLTTHRAGLMS
jgi:hypothetical protein